MPIDCFDELLDLLKRNRLGPVVEVDSTKNLLAAIWDDFSGDDTAMRPYKIARAESLFWDPPDLKFSVERHGPTVYGSSRAPMQHWRVDFETRSKTCFESGYRQVRPMQQRLNTDDVVESIITAIENSVQRKGIVFEDAVTVRVQVGAFIPSEGIAKATLAGRRKRFRAKLMQKMARIGWVPTGAPTIYRFSKEGPTARSTPEE